MRITTKAALLAFALAGALIAPAAQATGSTSPLASDSNMRLIKCSNVGSPPSPIDMGLLQVNSTTLQTSFLGAGQDTCDNHNIQSAAFNPDDAKVYANLYISSNEYGIATFDMVSGARGTFHKYRVDTSPSTDLMQTLLIAIDSQTGITYAIEQAGHGSPTMYAMYTMGLTLSTNGGTSYHALHQVTDSIGTKIRQIAFSPDGNLYGWDEGVGRLVTIDTSNGAVTAVPGGDWNNQNLGGYWNRMLGFAFDSTGTLFIFPGDQSSSPGKTDQIWYTKASEGFPAPRVMPGQNPNAGPVGGGDPDISANSPWTGNLGSPFGTSTYLSRTPLVITYGKLQVKYDGNGGKPAWKSNRFMPPSMLTICQCSNTAFSLPAATRTGYTFNGWFDAATGGTKIGVAGDSYTPTGAADINMYAQWTEIGKAATLPKTGSNENQLALAAFMILAGLVSLGLGRKTAK